MVNPDTAIAQSLTKTQATVVAPVPLERPASSPPLFTAGLAIAAIAAVAFFLKRRGPPLARRMRVVETLALGPKRSLCLAEIDGRTLVLGVSEAGVTLVSSHEPPLFAAQPAQPMPVSTAPMATALPAAPVVPAPRPGVPTATTKPVTKDLSDAFDLLLREATAEQDLRSSLQQRQELP